MRILILLTLLLCGCASPAPLFTWKQDGSHLELEQQGRTVWRFNADPADANKPYFHPVALPGGDSLTGFRPKDHPWHYGLWFSWKYLNGVNYWELPVKGLTSWRLLKIERRPDFSARIELALDYRPSPGAEVVLSEQRRIDISPPAADGSYTLDWTLDFHAGGQDLECSCTPLSQAHWGGYAGLSARFSQELTEAEVHLHPRQLLSGDAFHHCPGQAADFSGRVAATRAGLAMIDHPGNPRRCPWYIITDPKQPFWFLNAALLQDQPLHLRPGEKLRLRYRVAVHPGAWDESRLEAESTAFARTK